MKIKLTQVQWKNIFNESEENKKKRLEFLDSLDKQFEGVLTRDGSKTIINVKKLNKNCKKLGKKGIGI